MFAIRRARIVRGLIFGTLDSLQSCNDERRNDNITSREPAKGEVGLKVFHRT
jgi:hypothetical protein